MKLNELIKDELQHEVAITRKFLERIPDEQLAYQPHSKSMTMQQVANHLTEIPGWVASTMSNDALNLDGYQPPNAVNTEEMIKVLDQNEQAALNALDQAVDEDFDALWSMIRDGETIMSMPRYQVLRKMVLPQLPHHRAQLGTYLRQLDIPVPSSYGPSADEQ